MASTPQVLAKDADWLSASPEDQKGYLAHVDPDFAKATPEDQEAYRQHVHNEAVKVRSAEPTQFEKERSPENQPGILHSAGIAAKNILKGFGETGMPANVPDLAVGAVRQAGQTAVEDIARKEEGRSKLYRAAAPTAAALVPFLNPRAMEEHANVGNWRGVLGETLPPLAAVAAGHLASRYVEGAPQRFTNKGYSKMGESLAIPTGDSVLKLVGPEAAKDVKLAGDLKLVQPELAEIQRSAPIKAKGSEGMFELAGKIYDHMDRLWQQAHAEPIQRNAQYPIDNQAVVSAGRKVLSRELLESDPTAKAANDFLERISGDRNVKSADDLVRYLNEDLKSPAAQTSYGAAQNLVKKAVLQELRKQIDRALIDNNEQGVKDWNRKWGALDNVSDRVIQRAVAEAKAEGREPAIPRYLHMYSFFHGGPEGALGMSGGLAFRPQEVLRGVPSGQMRAGMSALGKSPLEAKPFPVAPTPFQPRGLFAPPTTPEQATPAGWSAPDTSGAFRGGRWTTPAAQIGGGPTRASGQPIPATFLREIPKGGKFGGPVAQLPEAAASRQTPFTTIPPEVPPEFAREEVNPQYQPPPEQQLGAFGKGGVIKGPQPKLPAPPTPVEWKGENTPLAPVGQEAQGFKGRSLGGLKAVEEAMAPKKAARAEVASKPFAERYSPEEVDEARAILQREVDVLSEPGSEVGRRPNLRQREAGSHHANTEEIAGWTATKSGKPMMDVLTEEFKEGPQQLAKALKSGKGKLYEKMVDAAVDWIRSHPEGRAGEEVNFFEGIPGFEETPEVEVMNPEEATKNASGESEASLEATRSGQKFRIVNERGGNPRPVSAVDARGGMRTNPGERIEVLDHGRWVPYR